MLLLFLFLWQWWEEETVWLIFRCWQSSELVVVILPASATGWSIWPFEGEKAEVSAIFCTSHGALEMDRNNIIKKMWSRYIIKGLLEIGIYFQKG